MAQQQNNPQETTINWDDMAEAFDRWLPYIQPVAETLIDLADIAEGHAILDVAAGTGEPSLTLARRHGHQNISITGVDGAEAMVARANMKANKEGLPYLQFQHMKAETLSFENARFDRVISRFGVMLFDDPPRGVDQMRRVLKHGGKMAIAVWGEFHKITSLHLVWNALMQALPEEKRLPLPRMASLGAPGLLHNLLEEAGFEHIQITPLNLFFRFDDFESYWKISTEAGLLKEPLDTFSPEEQEKLKQKVKTLTASYQENGQLVFQNEALVAFVIK